MSSPEEVYYVFKGYFDKEEQEILLMRKVAQAASAGFVKPGDFENFWPGPKGSSGGAETPSWASTSIELRNKLLKELKK